MQREINWNFCDYEKEKWLCCEINMAKCNCITHNPPLLLQHIIEFYETIFLHHHHHHHRSSLLKMQYKFFIMCYRSIVNCRALFMGIVNECYSIFLIYYLLFQTFALFIYFLFFVARMHSRIVERISCELRDTQSRAHMLIVGVIKWIKIAPKLFSIVSSSQFVR